MHKHHIIPRHLGGTDDKHNLTYPISVEDHAIAHWVLYRRFGKYDDYIAWKTLDGQIPHSEANRLILRQRAIGNDWRKGKTHTTATIQQIATSLQGNTNKKGKTVEVTPEAAATWTANLPDVNPMSNPESVERVRQQAFKKKPCPNCGKEMNPGNLTKHLRKCLPV